MLCECFPKMKGCKIVVWLNAFFTSAYYPVLIAVLMVLSNLFSLELPVYYIYIFFVVLAALLAEDLLPVVPVLCCSYMTVSAPNNPADFSPVSPSVVNDGRDVSVFYKPEFQLQLAFLIIVAALVLIARLIFTLIVRPNKRAPKLCIGFAVLGAAYLLGGAFSGFYAFDTVLFGFVQVAALCIFYFLFYYTVDWKKVKIGYWAFLFTVIGFGMVCETIGLYFLPGVVVGGEVIRAKMVTGWGMYNNVGCILAMCLPAPFYFAAVKKYGWIFTLTGTVFMLALAVTQSRGSALFGCIVYAACAVAVLIKSAKAEKIAHVIVFGSVAVVLGICAVVLWDKFIDLFNSLIGIGFNDNGRFEIYRKCLNVFTEHPWFGVGFYETPGFRWGAMPEGSFLPPRAHDTYMQLLASGGIVALAAYLYHRAETLLLFFRRPSAEKTFIAFSAAALVLTSILDCHFFNFGPALLYSVILICAEGTEIRDGIPLKKRKKAQTK